MNRHAARASIRLRSKQVSAQRSSREITACTHVHSHIAKDDPTYQIESHHYCTAVKGGVFQCTLYDKDKGDAKLIGVEYVMSDELFQKLPPKEKAYWHPHGYEISAGLLTFTGIKKDCQKKLVKGLHNTWGKVWQT